MRSLPHSKVQTKGTYYLGKYLLLRERISTARSSDMTLAEIALMLKRYSKI